MEATKNRTFRPWKQNQERLDYADKVGINVSELINECLDKCGKAVIESKVKKLREALAHPVN